MESIFVIKFLLMMGEEEVFYDCVGWEAKIQECKEIIKKRNRQINGLVVGKTLKLDRIEKEIRDKFKIQ